MHSPESASGAASRTGLQVAHAIGPSMDFWVALRAALAAVNPDAVTIGEATDTPDSLRRFAGKLHGILDFPLARALRHAFATDDWSVSELDGFLNGYERYMNGGPGRATFLDNHDMDRLLYLAGDRVDRLKLAALCQFTLAGTPIVYYGTEIGLSQQVEATARAGRPGSDSEARRDMPWDERTWNRDLLDFYKQVIRARRSSEALQKGRRRTLRVDAPGGVYAYERQSTHDRAMTVMNLSGDTRRVSLPAEGRWSCVLATRDMPEPSGGRRGLELTLPASSGCLLAPR